MPNVNIKMIVPDQNREPKRLRLKIKDKNGRILRRNSYFRRPRGKVIYRLCWAWKISEGRIMIGTYNSKDNYCNLVFIPKRGRIEVVEPEKEELIAHMI